ncbi:MAG: DUF2953 domain-containing protein [Clostridia bacterium]|nr:DUF2953 domain-containing protein [Clostridia bacterium]
MVAFLIVLFVLFVILMLKVRIVLEYNTEVALTVQIYGIPIRILPAKKRRVKPMTAKQAEKIRIRRAKAEEAKRLKAAKKAKAKAEKKKAAAEKKQKEKTDPEARRKAIEAKKKKKAESATLEENLDLVKKIATVFFSRFFRHFRIELARLHIIVGSDEAAKTAMTYGIVVQAVAYILALLDKFANFHGLEKRDVYVDTDFLSEEMKIDVKIAFSLRLWHLFHILFGALGKLIKNRVAVRRRVAAEHHHHRHSDGDPPPKNPSTSENPA